MCSSSPVSRIKAKASFSHKRYANDGMNTYKMVLLLYGVGKGSYYKLSLTLPLLLFYMWFAKQRGFLLCRPAGRLWCGSTTQVSWYSCRRGCTNYEITQQAFSEESRWYSQKLWNWWSCVIEIDSPSIPFNTFFVPNRWMSCGPCARKQSICRLCQWSKITSNQYSFNL